MGPTEGPLLATDLGLDGHSLSAVWRRALPLVLLAACGGTSSPTATADIDLGVVPLGGAASIRRALPLTDGLDVRTDHPDLTLTRTNEGRLLEITYRPSTLEPLEATVELVWEAGAAAWRVTGTARLPETRIAPEALELGPSGFADLWAWPEPGLDVELVDGALPACPGAPCVERLRDADERGLPATFRVRGPLAAPATVTVSTCPLPACRIEVTVRPAPECGPLVFDAAPVGQASLRNLHCPGSSASVDDTALEIVASSTAAVTVGWTPEAPGPFEAELSRGDAVVPIRGYAVEAPPCRTEVAPSTLAFGAVGLGGFVERPVTVRNLGAEPCLWSGAATEGPAFSLHAPAPRWIEGSEALELQVRFTPTMPALEAGRAHLWVADAPEGGHPIELAGRGVTPDIEVLTDVLDFGTVTTCTDTRRSVRVVNRGHAPGLVRRAEISGPGAEHLRVDAPAQLRAGALVDIPVRTSVQAIGPLRATLELGVEDSAGARDYQIPIRGTLDPNLGAAEDTFEQLAAPLSDVVFVIDPMGPSNPAVENLRANLQAFMQFIRAQALRANVAVVSARTSSAATGVFEPDPGTGRIVFVWNEPDFADAFLRTALDVAARPPGPNRAIGRVYEAVTSSASAEVVRPTAVLGIISIGLTEDGSEDATEAWLNRMWFIKGFRNTNHFQFSAIVGETPAGCDNGDYSAEAAPRHISMATDSGGVFQSICTPDWSRALEDLSTVAFGFKSRFFLSEQPLLGTIEVWVDGQPEPERDPGGTIRWTYDYATNSINFSPFATPEPGAAIVVRYRVACP